MALNMIDISSEVCVHSIFNLVVSQFQYENQILIHLTFVLCHHY